MNQNILHEYKIKETIGKGTFSKVKLGINKSTGEKVAIKILEKRKIKNKIDQIRVERELNILKKINHINIVKIIHTKEDQNNFYIIMEFINYDLFLHIVNNKRLDEKESSLYFFQIIQGLEYLHSLKIVHRDLKPENLLITKQRILKIIDFGLSNYLVGEQLLSTPCGSPSYTPPEMIKGYKYDGFAVDVWSSGIILYGMLCGYLPFEGKDSKALFKKIIKCKVAYPNFISHNAQNLLKKILVVNPDKRITILEIKKHPFYLEGKDIFYKRYPDLIDKIENRNDLLLNNNSTPSNIPAYNSNNIKTKTFTISNKKEKDDYENNFKKEKDKSSSAFSKHNKNKKIGPNFDLLKKILRGSKTNSCEKDNIINTDRPKGKDEKMIIEGGYNILKNENEKNLNYSPYQSLMKINNSTENSENKYHIIDNNNQKFIYKQKFLNSDIDTNDYEDEKNVDYLKNSFNNYSSYVNSSKKMQRYSNTKRNQKNDYSFFSNSKEIFIKGKLHKYQNTVVVDDKTIHSINNNIYTHNYHYKFQNNIKGNNKNNYSISSKKRNSSNKYFDSFYDKSNDKSSRIKSYIIDKANNNVNNIKIEKNNSANNRKIKKSNSPGNNNYSGLSKKIIRINNLYNSIQNRLDSYHEPQDIINKFEENENKKNLIIHSSLESKEKVKSKKNLIIKKNKIYNSKSEENRKKKINKNIKKINNIKYSSSYLKERLNSLKNSNNNSKININLHNNNSASNKKNFIEPINNNNLNVSQKNKKNKKAKEDTKKNHKKTKDNDKYNIKEIIKRRGLDKKTIK